MVRIGKTGKPITGPQVAALLRPYNIKTNQTVRKGAETAKGYDRAWFEDEFARYLPPSPAVTRSPTSVSAGSGDFQSVTPQQKPVTRKPNVTDEIPENRVFLRVVTV